MWGLNSVFARYLMNRVAASGGRMGTLQMMVVLSVLAIPSLFLFSTLPKLFGRAVNARRARAAQLAAGVESAAAAATAPARPPMHKRLAAGTGIGFLVTGMCIAFYYAATLLPAYMSVLATMSTPLFVAIIEAAAKRRRPPMLLFPAVLLTLGASGITVAGSWNGGSAALSQLATGQVLAGLCLAFGGAVLMAVYMVAAQMSAHLVSCDAIMWANRVTTVAICLPLAFAFEGGVSGWAWLRGLDGVGWGVMVAWATLIYTAGVLLLQVVSRRLGSAAPVAMCVGLRLVGSLAFQALLLPQETPTGALAAAGIVLVILTVSAYLGLQAFRPDLLDGACCPWRRQREGAAPPAHELQRSPASLSVDTV